MAESVTDEPLPGDDGSTTGHRSHRLLRLSLAVVVLALFIAVGVEATRAGWLPPSISHSFYTPAHNVFVASLIAASLALIALAGRDLETVFLDIAAVFAPLIALIPTGIDKDTLARVTGQPAVTVEHPCDGRANCIPAEYFDQIGNGLQTYVWVLAIVVLVALALRAPTLVALRKEWKDLGAGRRVWTLCSVFAAPLVAVAVAVWVTTAATDPAFPFNGLFGLSVHFTATILFFAAFTAVPVTTAVKYFTGRADPSIRSRHAAFSVAVTIAMLIDIAWLIWTIRTDAGGSWVLVGEAIALSLFAVFWVVQTVQRWDDPDQPSIIARRRATIRERAL